MSKKIGKEGLELVKSFEGCSLKAYKDAVNVWTIGYGHTGKVDGKYISSGMKITTKKAEELLIADIQNHANYVDNPSFCPITKKLNDNQRDALISFCFNVGPGNLKKLCANRTSKEISENIIKYNRAGGKVLAGLTRRRKAEQKLFNTPVKSTTQETSESKPKKYNFATKTAKEYNKKLFVADLKKALKANNITLLSKTITLSDKINSKHVIVRFVQKYLKHLGYYEGTVTKIFDANTVKAVKLYQKNIGTDNDGIITAKKSTWKKLIK